MFLDAVQILNRDIKGRTENLNPLFAIGGVYPVKNPFFLGRIQTDYDKNINAHVIKTGTISSTLEMSYNINNENINVKKDSRIGFIDNFWANENDLKNLIEQQNYTIARFFDELKFKVRDYYETSQN